MKSLDYKLREGWKRISSGFFSGDMSGQPDRDIFRLLKYAGRAQNKKKYYGTITRFRELIL